MDYEKIASAANSIDCIIRDNEALKTVLVDASSLMINDQSDETRQIIQDFLDAPLDSKKDIAMKKALAAALVIARDKEILPGVPEGGSEIAAIVDESLAWAKTAYKVGTGQIEPEEAVDCLVDHAEARATALVDNAFDSGLVNDTVTESIISLAYCIPEIGPVIGPAAEVCRPLIKAVVTKAEPYARIAIKAGINYVSSVTKVIARKTVDIVKTTIKTVSRSVRAALA